MIRVNFILLSAIGLGLIGCQSSNQSAPSSPSMPSPPSQNTSSIPPSQPPSSQSSSGSAGSSKPSLGAATTGSESEMRNEFPEFEQVGAGGMRDGSSGDILRESGEYNQEKGLIGSASGNYSLENLANSGKSGNTNSRASVPMTADERAEALDERLRKGYETFDGFILSEREQTQIESDAAGSSRAGTLAREDAGSSPDRAQTMQESDVGNSGVPAMPGPRPSAAGAETFEPPEDIPAPEDTYDDAVARQLRDMASIEPDPELREALWQEYRSYKGISGGGSR